jgi:prepilin-type N-terminal cleavage/methylation domain-containing protein
MKVRKSPGGFTLIEMVAAAALAAILLGAALAVFSGIARDRARLVASQPHEVQNNAALMELLRKDLASATSMTFGTNLVVLQSFGSLDPATLESVDRPSRVTYRLLTDLSPPQLVREQLFLDEPAPRLVKALLAVGITRFDVQRLSDRAGELLNDTTTQPDQPDNLQGRPRDLPRRLQVTMEFQDPEANVREILCAR